MRRLLHSAVALLLFVSCATSTDAQRRRAVTPPASQWNHEWARGAVFYEVFVRSFQDSNGDGKGDLTGLTSRLDYISSLGVDAIWLMPVFQSPSYHGYDITDYATINSDYGTNADFQTFLGEAHKRGIRVILDFVMNHTSSEHPWFTDPSKHDWYVWSPTNLGWTQPWGGNYPTWYQRGNEWYYAVFWSGMPDLNWRTQAVKDEIYRLARLWLANGVDGFRLDATRYLVEDGPGPGQADTPETHAVLKEFASVVRGAKPESILVAENTVDTKTLSTYYDDVPMNFNFPLATSILNGVKNSNATDIRETLRAMIAAYPPHVIDAPFLTNHDQTRIASVLNNDAGELRDAAAILLTLPGAPFIYYGEELGMQNGPTPADESKRTPMAWTPSGGFTTGTPWFDYSAETATNNVESEANDPQSLLSYYRAWIAVRKHDTALMKGDITPLDGNNQLLAFVRDSGDERVLVAHNVSAVAANNVLLNVTANGFDIVHADAGVGVPTRATGGWTVTLPPHTSAVWRVR